MTVTEILQELLLDGTMYRCLNEPQTDRRTDTDRQNLQLLKEFLINIFRLIKKTNKQLNKKRKPLTFFVIACIQLAFQ